MNIYSEFISGYTYISLSLELSDNKIEI